MAPYKTVEENRAYNKKYYAANKEQRKAQKSVIARKYYAANKDEIKAYQKGYRTENPDKLKIRHAENYRKNKENGTVMRNWLISKFKNDPCMDCNVLYPYYVMEFDHREREVKEFNISKMGVLKITQKAIDKTTKELNKCDYVCANCHRERSWGKAV